MLLLICPPPVLLYTRSRWFVAMFGIAGILAEQLAGQLGALAAVDISPALRALRDRTFAMKRVSVCLNTSAAAVCRLVFAAGAMQTASRINHLSNRQDNNICT